MATEPTAESVPPSQPTELSPISPSSPSSPSSQPIPSSPKPIPPPPIDTNRNSFVLPESSIMATTPAAMESAMRFEREEARRSQIASNPSLEEARPVIEGTATTEAEESENAITSTPAAPPTEDSAPGIVITLLILSGARSTFTINPTYMTRHNVSHPDPMLMTVYNLKECVWRDWKEDDLNTKQPASPHLIRLILLGRLLEDKSLLRDCRLNLDSPNVVHLSLRPADITEDEVTSKNGKFTGFNGSGNRTGDGASPGCRCVIL